MKLERVEIENFHPAKVSFVGGSDQNRESEMQRRGGHREIVRGNEVAGAAETGEQTRPFFRDGGAEVDDRRAHRQRLYSRAPSRGAVRIVREVYADEQFRVHDRRKHHPFVHA